MTDTEGRTIPDREKPNSQTSDFCTLSGLTMVSQKVAALLLVAYVMVLLVEHSEGFLSFVSHNDATKMKERERNRILKKSVNLQPRSEGGDYTDLVDYDGDEAEIIKLSAPTEFGMRLDSRQLQKYWLLLEMLLNEKISESQKAD
ncbi:promotilin isoform X2 [Rhinatrema bivittatum]|uniref:promotilin isoform X2 n=1 Tax=Rhinatrema bivittatum TaxID=194408 RepID=UPI00112D3BEA|nr:promotilin isoform X2 [Rhinatrema bivittatum]